MAWLNIKVAFDVTRYAIAISSSTISVFWSVHSLPGVGELEREQQLKVGPDVKLPCPRGKAKVHTNHNFSFSKKITIDSFT